MRIIVFDWDDTLFPTTYLLSKNEDPELEFPLISQNIKTLLSIAKKYGHVYIITNAHILWVEKCILNHLIDCEDILKNVHIISTINSGIANYTAVPLRKTVAFQRVTGLFTGRSVDNQFISLGDSEYDRAACVYLREKLRGVLIKSIKFSNVPDYKQLLAQQNKILETLEELLLVQTDLDLMLELEDSFEFTPTTTNSVISRPSSWSV